MRNLLKFREPVVDENISQREVQVLELTSEGHSSREIADLLHISKETVKSHRKHLLLKLNARNAAQLVKKGFEYRLLVIKIRTMSQLRKHFIHLYKII